MKSKQIIQTYNIHFRGTRRVYKVNLTEENYGIEFASPYEFVIDSKEIQEFTWARLVQRLTNYLSNNYIYEKDALCNHEIEWSKVPIFLKEKKLATHIELDNGLFLN